MATAMSIIPDYFEKPTRHKGAPKKITIAGGDVVSFLSHVGAVPLDNDGMEYASEAEACEANEKILKAVVEACRESGVTVYRYSEIARLNRLLQRNPEEAEYIVSEGLKAYGAIKEVSQDIHGDQELTEESVMGERVSDPQMKN
jgi:hypothetical protein